MRTTFLLVSVNFIALSLGCDKQPAGPDASVTPRLSGSGAGFVADFDYSPNMHPLGYSPRVVPLTGTGSAAFNTDLAFWGRYAYQGHYNGFRILDISAPARPAEIVDFADCRGSQGDVVVWQNILIRSWNPPAQAATTCGGIEVPAGERGLHVFDVREPGDPRVLAFVPLPCGSHTATAVPDAANGRLLVYSSPASSLCGWFDIVEIPLDDPAGATPLAPALDPLGVGCHDIAVIMGAAMKAACAGGPGVRIFSIGGGGGGSLESPTVVGTVFETGVNIAHTAAWTADGKVLVFGHEPGGGGQARCQESSPEIDRSLFFYDGSTGVKLGSFVMPRPQAATENCTWHNFHVLRKADRYVLVSGNYQSGISIVDFTDPANAYEVAYADPAPLAHPTDPDAIVVGGDWSTYWYNGFLYQSDMKRGLLVWRLADPAAADGANLGHLNPQTQEP